VCSASRSTIKMSSDDSKPYTDREWLYERYVERRQSTHEIAEQVDVSHVTILTWLDRHDIERRPAAPRSGHSTGPPYDHAYRDPAYLRLAYWARGQSMEEIARVCGVGSTTVRRWMVRHDIERRDGVATRRRW